MTDALAGLAAGLAAELRGLADAADYLDRTAGDVDPQRRAFAARLDAAAQTAADLAQRLRGAQLDAEVETHFDTALVVLHGGHAELWQP
jgi:hypothetical protein